MNSSLKEISQEIKNAKSIAIFTHKNPDLDAFGSSLALYYACKQLGKDVDVFLKDDINERNLKLIGENPYKNDFTGKDYDRMISIDIWLQELHGAFADIFCNGRRKIVLDHHSSDSLKGDLTYRKPNYSSCSEVVNSLIKTMKIDFTEKIASLIFVGLTGDTNSFINTNVNAGSFYTAYKCVKANADITNINEIVYKTKTKKDIELEKYLLNNFKLEGDIAYCLVTLKTLEDFNAVKDDCGFYSSELLSMDGVNISFSIIEQSPNFYSVSLRGKYGYNVRDIATKFGGGGHINAAGIKKGANDINEFKDQIINEAKRQRMSKWSWMGLY